MSYEKAMKHFKNHKKDRFYQQCSGYAGNGESAQLNDDEYKTLKTTSFLRLLSEAKGMDFPIFIAEKGGFYCTVDEKDFAGMTIENYEDLEIFGKEYVFDKGEQQ